MRPVAALGLLLLLACRDDIPISVAQMQEKLRLEIIYDRLSVKLPKYEITYSEQCWVWQNMMPATTIANGGAAVFWADSGDSFRVVYYAEILQNGFRWREEIRQSVSVRANMYWYP